MMMVFEGTGSITSVYELLSPDLIWLLRDSYPFISGIFFKNYAEKRCQHL
jgi:hypothetical protein